MSTDIAVADNTNPVAETNLVALVARLSCDERVDADKMERLFNLQLKHAAVVAEGAFNAAMSACQREMPQVVKNKKGENTRYANLEEIDRVARPVYSKHGFSLSFGGDDIKDGMVTVHCRLSHRVEGGTVGHSVDYKLSGAIDTSGPKGGATKTGIQGMGSTSSYLRRYLTCMIFNIAVADEDNDGKGEPWLLSAGASAKYPRTL